MSLGLPTSGGEFVPFVKFNCKDGEWQTKTDAGDVVVIETETMAAVADFWAGCVNCQGDPVDAGPCVEWATCDAGETVLYCETTGAHGQWYGLNSEMLDFFDGVD